MESYQDAANKVRRLLEGLGGSASAYEPEQLDPIETPLPPQNDETRFLSIEDEGCGGFPLAAEHSSRPLVPGFTCQGPVDDAGELQAVYDVLEMLSLLGDRDGVPSLTLERGTFLPRRASDGKCWEVEDTQKGILYREENHLLSDQFRIQVQRLSDQRIIGYLVNGWVFMPEK